jgi:hypothetical protein
MTELYDYYIDDLEDPGTKYFWKSFLVVAEVHLSPKENEMSLQLHLEEHAFL